MKRKCEICHKKDATEKYDNKVWVCDSLECQLYAQESIDKASLDWTD